MQQQKILKEVCERIKQNLTENHLNHLELDGIPIRQFTKEIKTLIESYQSIEYLTLNDCQMTSLNNFPKLPYLTILQLSNNKYILTYFSITDDELFHILKNSHISHLMIDENRLRSIEKVSILRQLPNLEQLEIANNLMGDSDFYRQELFDRIPQLKIIDCRDKFGNIAIDSESDSEYLQNSMREIGYKNDPQKCQIQKSVQSGNIGDKGQMELLKLLGQNSQFRKSAQSQEIEKNLYPSNQMEQCETDNKQKAESDQNSESQQQMMEQKSQKRVKIFSPTHSQKKLIENSNTQAIDQSDFKQESFSNDFCHEN